MKKLMIVAALAASAVAFADNCAPAQVTLVYGVKMTVKTTKGVIGTAAPVSICTPGGGSSGSGGCTVLRAKDSTKFEGWIYDCVAVCNTIETGTATVWDSKRKVQLADAAFATTFLNVMGTKQKDAEWAWVFTGTADYASRGFGQQAFTLTGAGYGKFNGTYFTTFSGNFAGTATASYDLSKKNTTCCDPSQVWKCDALSALVDSDTVAFGTWTIKYNSSATKKYNKNGYLKVPSYVALAATHS